MGGKKSSGGFQSLDLDPPVFRGVMSMGWRVPTPVQRRALPVALAGEDVVCMARTGSGKTAAFLVPLLQKLKAHAVRAGARAVVLSPTRELAMQTERVLRQLAKQTDLRTALLVGGDGLESQFEALSAAPDVIVATPGRLMHLLEEISAFSMRAVQYLVFDEADRLFEMGFAEQLHQIMKDMPKSRQTVLFSATLPAQLVQFARAGLKDPQLIRLDVEHKLSEDLRLAFLTVRSQEKLAAFVYLMREVVPVDDMTIVFAATRHHCELLHELLGAASIDNVVIYGSMDQDARNMNLTAFRRGKVKVLIVTDVAARGIDVPLLNNVVNYSFPPTAKLFVHRVGRAARQGRSGTAFNLVEPEEAPYMADFHAFLKRNVEGSDEAYELRDMTPDMVHYGALPQHVLDAEQETVRSLFDAKAPTLENLYRVCEKAMMQYRRSRPDASRKGVSAAKRLELVRLHPLFLAMGRGVRSAEDQASALDLLGKLRGFRPSQTVLELKNEGRSAGGEAMSGLRRERRRKELLRMNFAAEAKADQGVGESGGAGESGEQGEGGGEGAEDAELAVEGVGAGDDDGEHGAGGAQEAPRAAAAQDGSPKKRGRPRLSAADKRKLKRARAKGGRAAAERLRSELEASAVAQRASAGDDAKSAPPAGRSRQSFRDDEYFIDYKKQGNDVDDATERALAVGAASETGGKGTTGLLASALEEAMLDVNPDEAIDMMKKRRVLHWDKRHNRYVKTTLGELGERQSRGAGKIRSEAGVLVNRKATKAVGETYAKWQRESHRRVAAVGEAVGDQGPMAGKIDWRNKKRARAQLAAARRGGAGNPAARASGTKKVRSELRTVDQLAKHRRDKQKEALRNMSKEKRRAILTSQGKLKGRGAAR